MNPDVSQREEEECCLFWAIICSPADTSGFCGHVLGCSLAFLGGVAWSLMLSQPCCRASLSAFDSHVSLELGARGNAASLYVPPCALGSGQVRSALFWEE